MYSSLYADWLARRTSSYFGCIDTAHSQFGAHSPSGNFQSHQPHHFLNPALRVNNGMTLDMDTASQGFANRVRRVPYNTFPPSSTGNLDEDGRNNPGGKYSVPGGGGGHPPDRNGGS